MNKNGDSFSININNIVNPIELQKIEPSIMDQEDIINNYNPFSINNVQSYNPIFSLYFPTLTVDSEETVSGIHEIPLQHITLNHHYQFVNMNKICDTSGIFYEKPVFIKFAPLLDPIHYMIGKYEEINYDQLRNLPKLKGSPERIVGEEPLNIEIFPKLHNVHNASYVDGFFCFLSSQLLHKHKFIHSIDFYGSYLGIQEKYKMNIMDDFEYIKSSNYFTENIGKLFTIFNNDSNEVIKDSSQKNKQRLLFDEDIKNFENTSDIFILKNEELDGMENNNNVLIEEIYEKQIETSSNTTESTSSIINSSSSESNHDECSENEWETDDSEEEEEDDSPENKVFAYMNNFPVQMICLEKCCNTLDSLFMENEMDETTAASAMFQIVITLTLYQKIFHFTHNDLHTNNIMYVNTDIEYLYYQYDNIIYKVPTHGKIFKIIDFGRSIYKYQNQILCSDSFAPQGDAHSQYNFEPFFNENKPRLDPNYSFDLCRLACSIYDFIIDDENDTLDEFQKTIKKWCTDDNGKNILYKNNGDERYPNFKLYKMISRTVHNCIPSEELKLPFFSKFKYTKKVPKKIHLINLDAICQYHTKCL